MRTPSKIRMRTKSSNFVEIHIQKPELHIPIPQVLSHTKTKGSRVLLPGIIKFGLNSKQKNQNANLNSEMNKFNKFMSEVKRPTIRNENLSPIKSGSPVLWLKSRKRAEERSLTRFFELKELEIPMENFCLKLDKLEQHKGSVSKREHINDLDHKYLKMQKKEEIKCQDLEEDKENYFPVELCLDFNKSTNSNSLSSSLNKSVNERIAQIKKTANLEKILIEDKSRENLNKCANKNTNLNNLDNLNNLNKDLHFEIDFTYLERIADGSSSTVYKAFNTSNGSLLVVKKFHSINDKKIALSFKTEVNFYSKLEHPNIIKCLGSEVKDNALLIYLEYIPGGSLGGLLEKFGALSEKLIRIYSVQILRGLQYLHSKGIVHRDIKCANVLLDTNGVVKLTDFGCSGQISLSASHNENDLLNSIKGTIPWMAPEVICQRDYGCKADIWSLGCLLIEMKTGKSPWGKLENFVQALFKIGRSQALPEFPQDISDDFRSFLELCVNRNPDLRADVNMLLSHRFLN